MGKKVKKAEYIYIYRDIIEYIVYFIEIGVVQNVLDTKYIRY